MNSIAQEIVDFVSESIEFFCSLKFLWCLGIGEFSMLGQKSPASHRRHESETDKTLRFAT